MRLLMCGALGVSSVLAGCGDHDPGSGDPDAAPVVDAETFHDAPFQCTPMPRAAPGPACLALAPAALEGTTPLGSLALDLDYFGAGDCITISHATIGWRGACGEVATLQFAYPVAIGTGDKRSVTQSFDATARFELTPPGANAVSDTAMIHVDVVEWQEGDGLHDLDITLTVTEDGYALAPVHVHGTFCDWPYYLC